MTAAQVRYNQAREHHPGNLLSLPPELQILIYSFAPGADNKFEIRRDSDIREPGLLSVCIKLRAEARPVYFSENRFLVIVRNWDVQAVEKWLVQASRALGRPIAKHMNWRFSEDEPNWANFETWLKMSYRLTCPGLKAREGSSAPEKAMCAAFGMVQAVRTQPLEVIESLLLPIRHMMATHDKRWLD